MNLTWEYLFPERNVVTPGDELIVELWQYTALGFDKLVETLGIVSAPRAWWYYGAPKQVRARECARSNVALEYLMLFFYSLF